MTERSSTRSAFVVERIYDPPGTAGAQRVLVDRLWPRGIRKADAHIDEWAKDVAPSTALRQWYGHQPERYDEFASRYRDELRVDPAHAGVVRLRARGRETPIVLLTATRDVEHSGARVLRDVLRARGR